MAAGRRRAEADARTRAEAHRRCRAGRTAERGEEHAALGDFRGAPENRGLSVHDALAESRRRAALGSSHVRRRRHSGHHRRRARRERTGAAVPAAYRAHAHARVPDSDRRAGLAGGVRSAAQRDHEYSPELAAKPHCVVFTKLDLFGELDPPPIEAPDAFGVYAISRAGRQGLESLLDAWWTSLAMRKAAVVRPRRRRTSFVLDRRAARSGSAPDTARWGAVRHGELLQHSGLSRARSIPRGKRQRCRGVLTSSFEALGISRVRCSGALIADAELSRVALNDSTTAPLLLRSAISLRSRRRSWRSSAPGAPPVRRENDERDRDAFVRREGWPSLRHGARNRLHRPSGRARGRMAAPRRCSAPAWTSRIPLQHEESAPADRRARTVAERRAPGRSRERRLVPLSQPDPGGAGPGDDRDRRSAREERCADHRRSRTRTRTHGGRRARRRSIRRRAPAPTCYCATAR